MSKNLDKLSTQMFNDLYKKQNRNEKGFNKTFKKYFSKNAKFNNKSAKTFKQLHLELFKNYKNFVVKCFLCQISPNNIKMLKVISHNLVYK